MKICVYEARPDELKDLEACSRQFGAELCIYKDVPCLDNAELAKGCEGVTILGQGRIDAPLLDAWKALGVRCVATRTIGFNHIDLEHAKSIGMMVCNSNYAPNGVAEYTVMMMLLVLRNYKPALWRGQVNDYSLSGLQGRELRNLIVGVVGAGRIGATVIQCLSGFGCKLLAWDKFRNERVAKSAEYVELDELFAKSDVITLHLSLDESTHHIISSEAISKMKDGVVLINCARGELMDLSALIEGIETKKIGGLGLDTVEGETGLVHLDHRTDILKNKDIAYLRQFPNVVMTQHMAFYTDAAVGSMVQCAIEGITGFIRTGECSTRLV